MGLEIEASSFCILYFSGALSCVQLKRYGEAIEWCDEGLKVEPENTKLRELRTKATKNKVRDHMTGHMIYCFHPERTRER